MLKRGYKDLQVWQRAMDLADAVYACTRNFPKEEMYGLTSQLRRSAVSIPSNLAEGCSRTSTREFIRFVEIAYGSLAETETQLLIANRQKFLSQDALDELLKQTSEIGRMMNGLIQSLEQRLNDAATDRRPLTAVNS